MRHRPISTPELQRRARQRREAARVTPLIYPRRVAAELLSVSIATLLRLEQKGRLRPIKLSGSPTSQTFYASADIEALIGVDHAD